MRLIKRIFKYVAFIESELLKAREFTIGGRM